MYWIIAIFMGIILIFSFISTFILGKSQKPTQNAHYDQSRVKTTWVLITIYLISVLGGAILIYIYIF